MNDAMDEPAGDKNRLTALQLIAELLGLGETAKETLKLYSSADSPTM